jgi:predicted RNase H-like HicB family nuclease
MTYAMLVTVEANRYDLAFPDCPGCAASAPTEATIAAHGQAALIAWLEAALLRGEVPPRPRTKVRVRGKEKVQRLHLPLQLATKLQLRWSRQDLGLTQADLARRMGTQQPLIARLERPGVTMNLRTMERAFKALGLKVSLRFER